MLDRHLTVLICNPIMSQWLRCPHDSAIGQPIIQVCDELRGLEDELFRLIRAETPPLVITEVFRSGNDDHEFGYYYDLQVELFEASGANLLITVTDVTAKVQAEFDLRQERNTLRLDILNAPGNATKIQEQ